MLYIFLIEKDCIFKNIQNTINCCRGKDIKTTMDCWVSVTIDLWI